MVRPKPPEGLEIIVATRQQIQIANDLIRFVNLTNDLLDVASYILREQDPDTGGPLINEDTGQPFTLPQLKQRLARKRDAILSYWAMIDTFITAYGQSNVVDALNAWGVSAVTAKQELDDIKAVIQTATQMVQAATDKSELPAIADYIDANSIKLPLVRRSWDI